MYYMLLGRVTNGDLERRTETAPASDVQRVKSTEAVETRRMARVDAFFWGKIAKTKCGQRYFEVPPECDDLWRVNVESKAGSVVDGAWLILRCYIPLHFVVWLRFVAHHTSLHKSTEMPAPDIRASCFGAQKIYSSGVCSCASSKLGRHLGHSVHLRSMFCQDTFSVMFGCRCSIDIFRRAPVTLTLIRAKSSLE